MLETRIPSREMSARTAARPLPQAPSRPAREATSRRPALRARRPLSASDRMARSETRLLTIAVTCTAVVCGLLVLYLAAYAHITLLGNEQASVRTALRQKHLENEMLRDTLARLQSPDYVTTAAVKMGMTCDHKHTYYITPPAPSRTALGSKSNSDVSSQGPQVANSGPTDSNYSARNN